MSAQGDSLKIPIEIKTDDLDEIQKLINEIAQAESDIRELKPRRGKSDDVSSRSAFTRPSELTGGIFGGTEGEATPLKGRDRSSKAPYQRENQFAKLQEKVENVEKEQSTVKEALGITTQVAGFATLIPDSKNIFGGIKQIAGKAFLPLAVITTINELIHTALDFLLAPGGLWDRRFRRKIKDEISSATERAEKAQIAQGLRIIRVSTYPGVRGEAYSANALSVRSGQPIYDMNMEARGKGLI